MSIETNLNRIEALIQAAAAKKTGIDADDIKVDFKIDLLGEGVRFTAEEMESCFQFITYGSLEDAVTEALKQATEELGS
jgi:hypothetical protein